MQSDLCWRAIPFYIPPRPPPVVVSEVTTSCSCNTLPPGVGLMEERKSHEGVIAFVHECGGWGKVMWKAGMLFLNQREVMWGGLLMPNRRVSFHVACNKNGQMHASELILGEVLDPLCIEFRMLNQPALLAEREFDALFKRSVVLMTPAIQEVAQKRLSLEQTRMRGVSDAKRARQ